MISESEASDSDDHDNSPESSKKVPLRFECPVNFSQVTTSVEKQSGQDLLTSDCLHSSDQELWVIRAPKDFDPRCLSGQKVKLHKSTTVETETGSKYDLQVTKNTQHLQQEGLSLLLPNEQDGGLATVPLMHGEINIMQSVAVPSVTIPPPAAPLNTQLPEGLRPRFKPFGWREPKPVNGHTFAQRRDSVHSEKKKKKKRKHDIEDIEEVDSSKKRKTEDVETDRLVADSNTSTELEDRVHKKKKKKKEKCEDEATEAAIEDISETPDSKKKKKKKKDKHRESSGDDEQIMIAQEVEDSEETTVSKKKKKKKKKKEEKDD